MFPFFRGNAKNENIIWILVTFTDSANFGEQEGTLKLTFLYVLI